jgi:hypothetical protein
MRGHNFVDAVDAEFAKAGTAGYQIVFQAEDGRIFIPTGVISTDLTEDGVPGTTFVKVEEY